MQAFLQLFSVRGIVGKEGEEVSTFVGICQKLSLIFSGERLEESNNLRHLFRLHFASGLITCHHGYGFVKGLHTTIVIIRPCKSHVTQRGSLETVAVAFHLGLCPASVVGIGKTRFRIDFAVLEVVGTLSHHFIRESAHVFAGMAGGTVVGLEEGIAFLLFGSKCIGFTLQITVEGELGVRSVFSYSAMASVMVASLKPSG